MSIDWVSLNPFGSGQWFEPECKRMILSNRQAKEADRVGGIELIVLWPLTLGPEPALDIDHEREATPAERAYAERLVGADCAARGLVPVHVRVAVLRRPKSLSVAGGETRAHLAITIIGRRWVHATGRPGAMEMWAS